MKWEDIAQYSYRYGGNWQAIKQAILKQENNPYYTVYENYICYLDEDYPQEFKHLEFPPWVLFYRGNKELLKDRKVTIVGSRKIVKRGKIYTDFVCQKLKKEVCISVRSSKRCWCSSSSIMFNRWQNNCRYWLRFRNTLSKL